MNFFRRNLPHWQPPSAKYFVTFRLVNSLPKEAILKIRNLKVQLVEQFSEESDKAYTEINRRLFHTYEKHLENKNSGPFWLRKQEIAELICDSIEYRNDNEYDLYAYCVMPNHVHLAFQLLTDKNKEKNLLPLFSVV